MKTVLEVTLSDGDVTRSYLFSDVKKAYQYCADWHKAWNIAMTLFMDSMRPYTAVKLLIECGEIYYLSSINSSDQNCYIKIIEREVI